MRLAINSNTAKSIKNDCLIIINYSLKYKISDVKMKEGKKSPTMWGEDVFICELKQYRLNDSLISHSKDIIIYK